MVEKCPLVMNGLITCLYINVLPLGSYDVLIRMDSLEAHRVKLDYYNKTFECMDEEGNLVVVKGIPKVISVWQVSAMQLKKFCRKGFQLYATHILETSGDETPRLETIRCYKNSRMCFLMRFQGFLQSGTLISQLNLCQEQHQCPRHPTG